MFDRISKQKYITAYMTKEQEHKHISGANPNTLMSRTTELFKNQAPRKSNEMQSAETLNHAKRCLKAGFSKYMQSEWMFPFIQNSYKINSSPCGPSSQPEEANIKLNN